MTAGRQFGAGSKAEFSDILTKHLADDTVDERVDDGVQYEGTPDVIVNVNSDGREPFWKPECNKDDGDYG